MKLPGGCHCGSIRYTLDWPASGGALPARRCNCGYCTRFDGTWTSHPEAGLSITVDPIAPPGRYRFRTGTAEFLFCSRCGVTFAALWDSPAGLRAVLNVHTLAAHAALEFERSETDFGGETKEARLQRRAANWIGRVSVHGG